MSLPVDGTALALGLCVALTLVNLAGIGVAGWRLGRQAGSSAFPAGAPVSLVRPVCGLEPFSAETLARGFTLDYEAYEIVFCVAEPSDPVLPLVRGLIAAHPGVPARIVVGDERVSDNPKLNNCVRGWDAARHDWIVIADSNVLMPADYLQRMQAAWRSDTGLVCSTPAGARPEGFWAEVECAFLNTLQARWQYTGEALGLGFAQGKSMLWHRPFLEARGGIRALAAEIAEDAAATKLVRAAGRRVHLVASPFEQPLGARRAAEVRARQVRWARLRRVTFPLFFGPEIVSGTLLPFALTAVVAGTAKVALLLLALAALGYAAEYALAVRAGWHRAPRLILAFLVRDALIPLVWAAAWMRPSIVWRGNVMDIRPKAARALRTRESAA